MKKQYLLLYLFVFAGFPGCIEETNNDKPAIEIISPRPCDTLNFGESFLYKVEISDNTGLGNISMDVHHNFGQHNHGAHETCDMDEPKEAVNPYENNWIFSLPAGETNFIFDTLLHIPLSDDETEFYDPGDYHFHIYITDNDGSQTFTTMDVKILR